MGIKEEQLLELVDCVYEAPLKKDGWHTVVKSLNECLPDRYFLMHLPGPTPGSDPEFAIDVSGSPDEVLPSPDSPLLHYYPIDPLARLLVGIRPGIVCRPENQIERTELARSEAYADFYIPIGFQAGNSFMAALAEESDRGPCRLGAYSRTGAKSLDDDRTTLDVFERLLPHLRRAARFHSHFDAISREHEGMLHLLDRSRHALFLVERTGKVRLANRGGEELLAREEGISTHGGMLTTHSPAANRALRRLLLEIADRRVPEAGDTALPIIVPRLGLGRPFEITVSRLGEHDFEVRGARTFAVTVVDPEQRVEPPAEVLDRIYGLTPAEARMAIELANGHSIDEYAEQAEVTRNTARSRLREIFSKTSTSRQGELVALVLKRLG